MKDFYFQAASREHIQKEREKARELKRSQWWRNQLGPGLCHHCGGKFPKSELNMDHLIPLARGGKTSKKNVVVSCRPCNIQKKYLTSAELTLQEMSADSSPA